MSSARMITILGRFAVVPALGSAYYAFASP